MEKVKIAGAQIDVRLGDVSHNRDTIIGKIREAATMSAALVVFPECALQGFCFNSLEEAAAVAESREGPSAEQISEVCRQEGVHAVYGYIEESGGYYYNSAILIGPAGTVANYRKVHVPFAGVERFLTPGDQHFQVHDLPFGKVGINICYDTNFPEPARVLKLLGAELIILPATVPRSVWSTFAQTKITVTSSLLTGSARSADGVSSGAREWLTSTATRLPKQVLLKRNC